MFSRRKKFSSVEEVLAHRAFIRNIRWAEDKSLIINIEGMTTLYVSADDAWRMIRSHHAGKVLPKPEVIAQ